MKKNKKIFSILAFFLLTSLQAEENKEYIVTAPTGLVLRSQPDMKSNKITSIPYGETVKRNNNFSKNDSKPYFEFYDNKMSFDPKFHGESSWYKIQFQYFEGYAYGFFLVERNTKNLTFFNYNENLDDLEFKRSFINLKSENGNIVKKIYSQIFYKNILLFQMEAPIILNETAFVKENFLYFEMPLTYREEMGYQGFLYPLYFQRFMKIDVNNKKSLTEKFEIVASPETSIMNNQIVIQMKDRNKFSMKIDLPEKNDPIFFINEIKIKVSNDIKENFKCLNKNKYFKEKPEDSIHTSSKLIQISLEENLDNIENKKIKIKICDKPMIIDFSNNSIE